MSEVSKDIFILVPYWCTSCRFPFRSNLDYISSLQPLIIMFCQAEEKPGGLLGPNTGMSVLFPRRIRLNHINPLIFCWISKKFNVLLVINNFMQEFIKVHWIIDENVWIKWKHVIVRKMNNLFWSHEIMIFVLKMAHSVIIILFRLPCQRQRTVIKRKYVVISKIWSYPLKEVLTRFGFGPVSTARSW